MNVYGASQSCKIQTPSVYCCSSVYLVSAAQPFPHPSANNKFYSNCIWSLLVSARQLHKASSSPAIGDLIVSHAPEAPEVKCHFQLSFTYKKNYNYTMLEPAVFDSTRSHFRGMRTKQLRKNFSSCCYCKTKENNFSRFIKTTLPYRDPSIIIVTVYPHPIMGIPVRLYACVKLNNVIQHRVSFIW